MKRLKGKVALISGAASGLAEAQAILYAGEGASVMLGDLQHELGNGVAELWIDGGWYAAC